VGYVAEITDYEVLDAGVYPATFVSVTPSVEDGQFGPYLDWEFTVTGAMLTDVKVTGRSSTSFGPTTKAREWATALLGRPLTKGERVDFGKLAGTPCLLLLEVVEKEKGTFNRITRILPAPKPAPKAAPAHVVQEQPSRDAFEAQFAAQARAAWESAHGQLALDELPPTPDRPF
jgi:hypothetical protein